jgi:hypothetical protein
VIVKRRVGRARGAESAPEGRQPHPDHSAWTKVDGERKAVIDALIAAVRAGELDDLFGQAAKTSAVGKSKKAA